MAVGGYGRREMCPGSDLDVFLLHRGRRSDARELKALAERLWYPVWDSGVKLGHAVRTVKEALKLAAADLDTATALLDTRLIAGDPGLAQELGEKAAGQWRSQSRRWLKRMSESVSERHQRAGEVAFLLEPDLKEGRGGLRDVHSLRWAEAARRILVPGDDEALAEAYDSLLAVRVELHRRTGKAADRLLLQDQDAVAEALGETDADSLMGRVASAARTIAWTSDEAWDRIESSLRGPSGRVAATDRPLGPGLVMREGVVELAPGTDPSLDESLVLRAAAAAAGAGTRMGRAMLDRLAAAAPEPGEPWPPESRSALVQLLAAGAAAIPVLESLDQKGLLVRMLPEWEAVRSRPQRNAYHRFTVDRHLCEAAAAAARHTDRVARPDLLLVGTWLHDIGKGFMTAEVPDHTDAGIDIVRRIGTRMGFSPPDVEALAGLVRHHLLLATAATRRDIEDLSTVNNVARLVGDAGTLDLLHALTEADGAATGPAAWSPWKAGLVSDLVYRVERALAGESVELPATFPAPDQLDLLARARTERQPVVRVHGRTVTVVDHDHPRMFCQVAGTLAVHGLDVLAARAWSSDDGMALEDFRVEPMFGSEPDWTAFTRDLRAALGGDLSVENRLAERTRQYSGRERQTAAEPAATRVRVDNSASESATVVEVKAPDRIGTLYGITRALANLSLDIRHAKVSSLGHEVIDSFYVVDGSGAKLTSDEAFRQIEDAVLAELARV